MVNGLIKVLSSYCYEEVSQTSEITEVSQDSCQDSKQVPPEYMSRAIPITNLLATIVGFEVLTAVVMKGSIFWDITPCSPLKSKNKPSKKPA
jgi:hypothetical protein